MPTPNERLFLWACEPASYAIDCLYRAEGLDYGLVTLLVVFLYMMHMLVDVCDAWLGLSRCMSSLQRCPGINGTTLIVLVYLC